jgi:hypothetical protein
MELRPRQAGTLLVILAFLLLALAFSACRMTDLKLSVSDLQVPPSGLASEVMTNFSSVPVVTP